MADSSNRDSQLEPIGIRLSDLSEGRTKYWTTQATPYWWRAAPPRSGPWTTPVKKADIVVIGAGFTGLSAALVLARAGRQVLVVDSSVPGYGASTRNGGQIGSGNQKFRVKTLIEMQGERKAIELLREGVEMLDGIETLIKEENIDCSFVRCGRFRGAMRPEHYEAMARDMKDLKQYAGVDSFMVGRAEQYKEIGTELFHGGSVLPMDASLHPGKYHSGLLDRVLEAGAAVYGNMPVRGISSEKHSHAVHFDNVTVQARDVLVATNGYTKNVGGFFRKRIVPIRSAQITTEQMAPDVLRALMPTRRAYGNTNRVFFYFRPAPDESRIIWGGRSNHFARDSVLAAYTHLARDLLRTFPMLGEIKVSYAWSGLIGYTFDEFPHLGRSPEGIHYAMGYCGTGVSRSTHFGRKIALQILGKADGQSAFSDLVFPSHRFQAFAKPAVPIVETWYRLRDAVGF
ncbi:FAD-dependent oxidoreductase [Bradyrhizobium sp. CCBAU 45394]|uniref:NAD(P)/FAD-dependent oxidoreductase n=1 Tax=Bradyrhizobium sp. CCBAU 45394 TaxID=1325087 RepID=UPI00230235C9|nr:FAD-binding oxidoreductase [Bradyrhizobium sp. CCBAU 45394]MDA9391681.1 FAD-dependent oxidoreductase [Bradyrhizobium sp. CCBAU 45394]